VSETLYSGNLYRRGRIFDPKLGRFLTTDPIVSNLYFGQSFNSYGYVLNNPLSLVDPSGFEPEPTIMRLPEDHITASPGFQLARYLNHEGPPPRAPPITEPSTPDEATSEAAEFGAAAPPTDVDTTGSSSFYEPQPMTTAPEDWRQSSLVQVEGGFLGGLGLGTVPFGSAIASPLAGPGTKWAEIGRAVGEIFGGGFSFTVGVAGMLGGGAASGTGVLTLPGVAAVVGSAALTAGGIANVMTGAERLGQALSMSSGSGSSGPQGTTAAGTGSRVTGDALKAQRAEFNKAKPQLWKHEAATNPQKYSAENIALMRDGRAPIGPDGFPMEIHHITPLSQGGTNHVSNLQIMTKTEHRLGSSFKANHPDLTRR
jgi:RHS repeat-associated protein